MGGRIIRIFNPKDDPYRKGKRPKPANVDQAPLGRGPSPGLRAVTQRQRDDGLFACPMTRPGTDQPASWVDTDTRRPYLALVRALGNELRRARREADMTQEDLAKKSKMDRSFISDIERGTASPSVATLFVLCRALGVAASELIRRVEQGRK